MFHRNGTKDSSNGSTVNGTERSLKGSTVVALKKFLL